MMTCLWGGTPVHTLAPRLYAFLSILPPPVGPPLSPDRGDEADPGGPSWSHMPWFSAIPLLLNGTHESFPSKGTSCLK